MPDDRSFDSISPVQRVFLGLVVAALGLGLTLLVGVNPEATKNPLLVIECLSGAIGLSGLAIGLWSSRRRGPYRWAVSGAVACGLVIPAWIAFGPGSRVCTRRFAAMGTELECRIAFGIAAIGLFVLLVVSVRHALAARNSA